MPRLAHDRLLQTGLRLPSAFAAGPLAVGFAVTVGGRTAARLGLRTPPFAPTESFEPVESLDRVGPALEVAGLLG
jgi:hypothetical protein